MSTVDIVVQWANTAIAVERLAERDVFTVGAAAPADHHFVCEHPAIPSPRFPLVENKDGVRIRSASGMKLKVDGRVVDAPEIVLGPTSRATVQLGALEIRVARDRRAPTVFDRLRDVVDTRLLRLSGFALALHAGFVALLFLAHAPAPLDDLSKLAPRFASTSLHAPIKPKQTRATPAPTTVALATKQPVRTAPASTRHRVLDDARTLARDAIAALHLDGGASSSVFGASGPKLDTIRGASLGDVVIGFGSRDTGGGHGGEGVGIGGFDSLRHPDAGGDGTQLIGGSKHKPTVITSQHIVYVGGLERDEIQRVVARVMPQIKYCYEKELNAHPTLEGKVVAGWIITGDGSVSTSNIAQSTLGNDAVGSCVARVISRLKFPQPKGNGQVMVTYPFVFSSSGT